MIKQESTKCRICEKTGINQLISVKEMMFGSKEFFDYFRCRFCGCLQIAEFPENPAEYYPENYYSFNNQEQDDTGIRGKIRRLKKKVRLFRNSLYFRSIYAGKILTVLYPESFFSLLFHAGVSFSSKILDLGCGSGAALLLMHETGFKNLSGADPFIRSDFTLKNTVPVYKSEVSKLSGSYDLIMLNHSFEHMAEPCNVLFHCRRLLSDNGILLIRIPLSSSYAFQFYQENWVSLDAPRHLFLHSEKSMKLLADKTGFEVSSIIYDSTEFQFWGSEQYQREIPLNSEQSLTCSEGIFSKKEVSRFRRMAKKLNQLKKGDQAGFFLKKK